MGSVHGLLSPKMENCLLCKQSTWLQPEKLGLCSSCFTKIPWIRSVLCPVCGRYEHCPDCMRRTDTAFILSRSSVKYDEAMKELLARYKYRGDERLKSVIGQMLVQAYRLIQKEAGIDVPSARQLITYVPVSERRLLERGFNQAEQMAAELGRRVGIPVVPLLVRAKHTDKQSFKKRSDRLEDLRDVFHINERGISQLAERYKEDASFVIYVVDDVYTTGSTMNQCAKAIKSALPADVYGLAWAR